MGKRKTQKRRVRKRSYRRKNNRSYRRKHTRRKTKRKYSLKKSFVQGGAAGDRWREWEIKFANELTSEQIEKMESDRMKGLEATENLREEFGRLQRSERDPSETVLAAEREEMIRLGQLVESSKHIGGVFEITDEGRSKKIKVIIGEIVRPCAQDGRPLFICYPAGSTKQHVKGISSDEEYVWGSKGPMHYVTFIDEREIDWMMKWVFNIPDGGNYSTMYNSYKTWGVPMDVLGSIDSGLFDAKDGDSTMLSLAWNTIEGLLNWLRQVLVRVTKEKQDG